LEYILSTHIFLNLLNLILFLGLQKAKARSIWMKPMIVKSFGEKYRHNQSHNYILWWKMYIIQWYSTWKKRNGAKQMRNLCKNIKIIQKSLLRSFLNQWNWWNLVKSCSNWSRKNIKDTLTPQMNRKRCLFMKGSSLNGLTQFKTN